MPVSFSQDDLLPQIAYQDAPPTSGLAASQSQNLAEKVASPNGRIVIIAAFGCSLYLEYTFSMTSINASVVLETPLGSATLGSAVIDPSRPTITIGGSKFGFKAEAKISFDFSSLILSFDATVCAPFVGCKSASGSLHL